MNSRRSRLAIGAALFATTLVAFSVNSAQAQSPRLRVSIPFGFYVAEKLLPPGDYVVATFRNGSAKISNVDGNGAVVFNTFLVSNTRRTDSAKLIFNRYGEDHFLSEMWWEGARDGFKPLPSKRERQLAEASAPARIAVARH